MKAVLGSSFLIPILQAPTKARRKLWRLCHLLHDMDQWADDPQSAVAQQNPDWQPQMEQLAQRDGLPLSPLLAMEEALQWDRQGRMNAPSLSLLEAYCDGVASSVGTLTLHILGVQGQTADACAQALGRAVQYTNILRDWREDVLQGRLYLAKEWLAKADLEGITAQNIAAGTVTTSQLQPALAAMGDATTEYYRLADEYLSQLPQHQIATARLMRDAYHYHYMRLHDADWLLPGTTKACKYLPLNYQWELWKKARHYRREASA